MTIPTGTGTGTGTSSHASSGSASQSEQAGNPATGLDASLLVAPVASAGVAAVGEWGRGALALSEAENMIQETLNAIAVKDFTSASDMLKMWQNS